MQTMQGLKRRILRMKCGYQSCGVNVSDHNNKEVATTRTSHLCMKDAAIKLRHSSEQLERKMTRQESSRTLSNTFNMSSPNSMPAQRRGDEKCCVK